MQKSEQTGPLCLCDLQPMFASLELVRMERDGGAQVSALIGHRDRQGATRHAEFDAPAAVADDSMCLNPTLSVAALDA